MYNLELHMSATCQLSHITFLAAAWSLFSYLIVFFLWLSDKNSYKFHDDLIAYAWKFVSFP